MWTRAVWASLCLPVKFKKSEICDRMRKKGGKMHMSLNVIGILWVLWIEWRHSYQMGDGWMYLVLDNE